MSYSFSVSASDKAAALAKVDEQMAKVVAAQPVHAADEASARSAAAAFVDVIAVDPDQDVAISVSGSIWNTDSGVQQASVSVSASLLKRKAAA